LKVKEGKTFRWEGEYTGDMNEARTMSTHLNVFAEFDPDIPARYRNSPYLFLANIDPEIQQRVLRQITNPSLVVSDTMNYWIVHKRPQLVKQLKKVDIALFNDGEAKLLSGESNVLKAAGQILKMGPKKVIVKRGEHGAFLFSKDCLFCAPAFLLDRVIDPTGAGDTFAGGLVGYLSRCKKCDEVSLRKALVYGTIMASFTVEDFSLRRLASISRRDIHNRVKEFQKRHRL
jgi:sugar/nucleoside kinase (ribokinase family)